MTKDKPKMTLQQLRMQISLSRGAWRHIRTRQVTKKRKEQRVANIPITTCKYPANVRDRLKDNVYDTHLIVVDL